MAFGLSGSQEKSQMEGADATIAYMVDDTRGYAVDYNITAKAPVITNFKTYSFTAFFVYTTFFSFSVQKYWDNTKVYAKTISLVVKRVYNFKLHPE